MVAERMNDPADYNDDEENPIVKLTSLVVLGVGLSALFLGYEWFWVVFVVGFAAVVPIAKVLTEALGVGAPERKRESESRPTDRNRTHDQTRNRTSESESEQDPLDALRSRYVHGELTEAEFERKVEALLETETPERARRHVERVGSSAPDAEIHETETTAAGTHDTETSDTSIREADTETNR
jgi:hypothetical protein